MTHPDSIRARLRSSLDSLLRELDAMGVLASRLRAPMGELVEQSSVGRAPELQSCPSCHELGVRGAIVCQYCWTKIRPVQRAHTF
ncbi:MAG: hypothetical protein HY791_20950 [Deltaproteobacteria bacterium]|nr:hypothetical protein [Deltaproteobacteria bacterium]